MNASTHPLSVGAEKPGGSELFLARSFLGRISMWTTVCADYFAAAATYEQLSALSDEELLRRGLARATLARDVCDAVASHSPRETRILFSNQATDDVREPSGVMSI